MSREENLNSDSDSESEVGRDSQNWSSVIIGVLKSAKLRLKDIFLSGKNWKTLYYLYFYIIYYLEFSFMLLFLMDVVQDRLFLGAKIILVLNLTLFGLLIIEMAILFIIVIRNKTIRVLDWNRNAHIVWNLLRICSFCFLFWSYFEYGVHFGLRKKVR